MSRPKVHLTERVTTTVRMPADLRARLLAAAKERELNANYLMCRAIEEYLDRLIPADELRLTR